LLLDELAGLEDGEVWDAAHVVAGRELRVALGVYFDDDGFSGHICRGFGYFGGGGPAGTAPLGPEVDEDGNGGALDDLVKERCVDLEGLGEWR
jgi:hypothetical protein